MPKQKPVKPQLPCETSCRKCGSRDIFRKHLAKGEELRLVSYLKLFADATENEFVTESYNTVKAKRECLHHSCRCCHWYWHTDTLDANSRTVVGDMLQAIRTGKV